MTAFRWIVMLVSSLAICCTCLLAPVDAQLLPKPKRAPVGIVADVNGEAITFYQLNRELLRRLRREQVPTEQYREARRILIPQILQQLIIDKLLLQRCDVERVTVSPEELQNFERLRLQEAREQSSHLNSVEDFYLFMIETTGDTREQIRQEYRNIIRRTKLMRMKVHKTEFITPRALRAHYLANKRHFTTKTTHHVQWLFIPRGDLTAILPKVEAALAQGMDFSEAVNTFSAPSQRGERAFESLVDQKLDSFLDPTPAMVRGLEVGAVSPRMEFPSHVSFVKVVSRDLGKALDFETSEAQELIRQRISLERRRKQYEKFISELEASARIRKYLD